jgi:hypothetical protein
MISLQVGSKTGTFMSLLTVGFAAVTALTWLAYAVLCWIPDMQLITESFQ